MCLARRLKRDILQRGRDVSSVLDQYERFVKPGFHTFISPTMRYADVIVPRARENTTTLGMLIRYICSRVSELNPDAARRLAEHAPASFAATGERRPSLFDPDGM